MHRHVFQHAHNRDIDFVKHINGFSRINQGDVLWRGNHDSAGDGDFLRQGKLDVAGAGRQIDKQVVHVVPLALEQQLLQGLRHHRAAPHDGLVGIDQKADGHDLDAVCVAHGDKVLVLLCRLLLGNAEHGGLAGAVQIRVQHADARAHGGHGGGQIGGGGGFAHAAFARSHGNDVFHAFDGVDAGLHFVGDDVIFDGQLHVFAGGGSDLPL